MKNLLCFLFGLGSMLPVANLIAQASIASTIAAFNRISAITDDDERHTALDQLWGSLQHIPVVQEDSALFLYRGEAQSVAWMGDFNGWGYDKTFQNKGTQIGGLPVWYLVSTFPKDSRFDYKIVVNDTQWVLDMENPYQQWSGVGGGSPNSELRMPAYREDSISYYRPDIAHGKVESDQLFQSEKLGYQLSYSAYIPATASTEKFPIIYVTDGYEYAHPKMGAMINILDNLIASHKIKPIIAIFIDHREPANRLNNRRMKELVMNQVYLDFFTEEFMPFIEKKYPVIGDRENRAIMGASLGGLTATWFAYSRPDLFAFAGIQSPSFWLRPQIYNLCDESGNNQISLSMTTGTINDTQESAEKMKDILAAHACTYHYREVNEGHSWGNWRNLIDEILIDFFGPK